MPDCLFSKILRRLSVLLVLTLSGCIIPAFEAVVNIQGTVVDSAGVPMANKAVRLCTIVEKDTACEIFSKFESTCVDSITDANGKYADSVVIQGTTNGKCAGSVGIIKLYTALQVDAQTLLTDQKPDLTEACRNSGRDITGTNTKHCTFNLISNFDQATATPNVNICAPILWYSSGNYRIPSAGKYYHLIPLLPDTETQMLSTLNGQKFCAQGAQIDMVGQDPLFILNSLTPAP